MNSEFWACLKCGEYFQGSQNEIEEKCENHRQSCVANLNPHKNITEIIKGLQEIKSMLLPPTPPPPPPPPPSISNSFLPSKKTHQIQIQKNNPEGSSIRKENVTPNLAPNDTSKMPISVVDGLENFFK